MTEAPHESIADRKTSALDFHDVVNSLAAIQCQWFVLKASMAAERLASTEVAVMDRLLSELSTRVEQLQNKATGTNKVSGAAK